MSVEEQVDRLLQKKEEKVVVKHFKFNRRNFLIAFGSMVVTALLLTMIFYAPSKEWMEETFFGTREENINVFADEYNNSVTYVYAENKSVGANETFILNINCNPVQPMKGFEFGVTFDPSLLQVNNVTEGNIFDGYSTFFNSGIINNTDGSIIQIFDLIVGTGNVSGNGSLVSISFTSSENNTGISPIGLINVGVTNETGYIPIMVQNGLVVVGDNSAAFHYWYAPSNTFGIQEIREVNWSWFWQRFNQYSEWQMEGWHPVQQEWVTEYQGTNLNEYLNISRVRSDDNGSEKITLNFTSPFTTRYRFTFGIDLRVRDYVNRTGQYEYELTYPVNNTENYTVYFNWSDVIPMVQNGTISLNHGVRNVQGKDVFWFRIIGNSNLQEGNSFEIDPTFGESGTGTTAQTFIGDIWGSIASPASDGTIDNITAYLNFDGPANTRCAIYNNATKAYVVQTEEKSVDTGGVFSWVVFNFSGSDEISTEIDYYICVWSSDDSLRFQSGGYYFRDKTSYTGDFSVMDPIVNDGNGASTVCIYASYTESDGVAWQVINNTYNGSLFNQSQVSVISNTYNGSLWNVTAVSVFNNSINGSVYNTSQVSVINNTINGSIFNTSQYSEISNTYNGSLFNQSQVSVISNIYNGSLWNASQMQVFNNIINGSVYNVSLYTSINSTINGSVYNTSQVLVISNTYNGSLWNVTAMSVFSNTYNGSIYNASQFSVFSNIINGSIYNGSQYILISNNINGSLWNVSAYSVFSSTINGSVYNTSQYSIFSSDINGSIYNLSVYTIISNNINGTIYNTSQYTLLFNTINGSLWNTSVYALFSDTINGILYNVSPYTIIQNNINGSLYNTTPPELDITLEYPDNGSNILITQPTLYFNLTSPTGSLMNYSIYLGTSASNCNIWLCNFSNVCNGTHRNDSQYYSAINFSTEYHWRVQADDGANSINESFSFNCSRQGGGGVTGYGAAMAIATGSLMLVVVVFALVMDKKRKERI